MSARPKDGAGAGRPAHLLAPFLRRHWPALALAGAGSVVLALTELAGPFPLKLLIDHFVSRGPRFTLTSPDHRLLVGVAALAITIALLEAVASYLVEIRLKRAGERITHELRLAVYAHLQRLSLTFHEQRPTGDLVTRLTGDVNAVGDLFSQSLGNLAASALLLVGMAVVSLRIDPILALAAFSVTPALSALTVRFRRVVRALARHQRAKEGELASLATEALEGVRAVRALGAERFEHERLSGASEERLGAGVAAAATESRFGGAIDVTGAAGWALVLVLGTVRMAAGAISPGDLVVMSSYTKRLYRPLRNIAKEASRVARAMARAERVAEVLGATEVVEERPGGYAGPRAAGNLILEDVSFAYSAGRPALELLSLQVPAGRRVAVVGRSGAGKSTLAALVARLHDPGSGRVLLDGRDVRDCSLPWLRSQVGLLLQDTVLFSGTVADNIAYATRATRAEVVAAARAAGAHGFITALPHGYDTPLGPRGVALSGGQRQRLAIARTLLRDPPVLLLDEPTVGLDRETEVDVLAGLDALATGRTTLVITHSPDLARAADHVVVLEAGRIVEEGPPAVLLARPGPFRRLLAEEFAGEAGEADVRPAPQPAPNGRARFRPAVPDDLALPALAVLVDAEAMATVLARSLPPDTPAPEVSVHRLRYRPGARLIAEYDVDVAGRGARAVAMIAASTRFEEQSSRPDCLALVRRVDGRSPAVHPLTYEPALKALIHWLPLDLSLPALAEPPEAMAFHLERAGLGDTGGEVALLGYTPQKRAVLGLGGHVLKLYASPPAFEKAATALRRASADEGLPTARFEAILHDLSATVQARLPGAPPPDPVAVAPDAGALLAAFHAGDTTGLPDFPATDLLAASARSAQVVAHLLPHLQERLARLLGALEAARPDGLPLVRAHGDFQGTQLVATPGGLVAVDIDHLCAAPAALDLVTYASYPYRGGEGQLEPIRDRLAGVLEGYGSAPPALPWTFACAVLRRSRAPFLHLDPDWPQRVEEMVTTAEAIALP